MVDIFNAVLYWTWLESHMHGLYTLWQCTVTQLQLKFQRQVVDIARAFMAFFNDYTSYGRSSWASRKPAADFLKWKHHSELETSTKHSEQCQRNLPCWYKQHWDQCNTRITHPDWDFIYIFRKNCWLLLQLQFLCDCFKWRREQQYRHIEGNNPPV